MSFSDCVFIQVRVFCIGSTFYLTLLEFLGPSTVNNENRPFELRILQAAQTFSLLQILKFWGAGVSHATQALIWAEV